MAYLYTPTRNGTSSNYKHCAYVYYTKTDNSDGTYTVKMSDVGELMTAPTGLSTYSSIYYYGASSVTGVLGDKNIYKQNSSTRRMKQASTFISFGGTTASTTYTKGTSSSTKKMTVKWTWNGTTSSSTTYITVPAKATYTITAKVNSNSTYTN